MAPCIVFIDEIDRLGGRKQSGENDGGTMGRAFSQLLEWLGDMNRNAIVIGATNMPYMDEAFRREGRFDVMIPMLSPDFKARQEILKVHLNVVRQVKHSISKKKIEEIAKATEGWKGNMLEELVKRATRTAFLANATSVSDKHLMESFEDYTINRDALVKAEDKYVQMARDLCNSQKFLKSLLEEIEEEKGLAIKKVAL
jgi:ATP-dependent Zn protease